VVGHRDRGHLELSNPPAELSDAIGTVQEGVLSVEVEMDEVGRHLPILARRGFEVVVAVAIFCPR
jgi:hypothetical protein